MYRRIIRASDPATLADLCASRLLRELVGLQATKQRVDLCLTGGRIANLVYERFAEISADSALNPRTLQLWWGDERFVPLSHSERNAQQALSILARTIPLSSANTHIIPAMDGQADASEAAFAYANDLGDTVFDICLLGMGEDGHVASIFPKHPSFEATTGTVIGVTNAPKPPSERISLTFNAINRSAQVWLLVSGEAKADAVAAVLSGDLSLPAAHARGREATLWFLDEGSAALLPEPFECVW